MRRFLALGFACAALVLAIYGYVAVLLWQEFSIDVAICSVVLVVFAVIVALWPYKSQDHFQSHARKIRR